MCLIHLCTHTNAFFAPSTQQTLSKYWENGTAPERLCAHPFSPPPSQGQGHALSHLLRAQLPSRHLIEVGRSSRVRGLDSRIQEDLFPSPSAPAHRSGEEMINKGSCLLSTWNIPGINDKDSVCHNVLNPKHTTPGELLTLLQRKKQRLKGM